MKLLFVTWDGPQVSYLESLFLPIFAGLTAQGVHTDVLQFRWGSDAQEDAVQTAARASGCGYRAAPVLRRGGAAGALLTAVAGGRLVRSAARAFGSDLLLPRSLLPAVAVLSSRSPLPVLFDSDGLLADEKVEFGGLSATSPAYRLLRLIERQMVRRSAGVLARTAAGARVLRERSGMDTSHFHLVTNGRDPALFHAGTEANRREVRQRLGIPPAAPLLVYAGSAGPQYRFDRAAAVALALRRCRPDARLLLLSGEADLARRALGTKAAAMTTFATVPASEVPALLAAADVGLSFRQPSFSMAAVAPIKIAEYLLCGLPVIGNAAIGRNEAAVKAGLLRDDDGDDQALVSFVLDVVADRDRFRKEARALGEAEHSLARSIADYRAAP